MFNWCTYTHKTINYDYPLYRTIFRYNLDCSLDRIVYFIVLFIIPTVLMSGALLIACPYIIIICFCFYYIVSIKKKKVYIYISLIIIIELLDKTTIFRIYFYFCLKGNTCIILDSLIFIVKNKFNFQMTKFAVLMFLLLLR